MTAHNLNRGFYPCLYLKAKRLPLRQPQFFDCGLVWFALAHLPVKGTVTAVWPTKSKPTPYCCVLQLPGKHEASSTTARIIRPSPACVSNIATATTALVSYQNGQPTNISTYFAVPQAAPQAPADTAKALVALKNLNDGLASRQLQTVIVLKADGKTIKSLTSYGQDGSYTRHRCARCRQRFWPSPSTVQVQMEWPA